jgi:hypothetical protein
MLGLDASAIVLIGTELDAFVMSGRDGVSGAVPWTEHHLHHSIVTPWG